MRNSKVVFRASALIIALFVVLGAAMPGDLRVIFDAGKDYITMNLGWLYVVAVGFFLIFIIALYLSPYSRIRLGKDDEEPEFSNLTWFAMLFSAGMGIGLLFWSVAEPVGHFGNPPRAESGTAALDTLREGKLEMAQLKLRLDSEMDGTVSIDEHEIPPELEAAIAQAQAKIDRGAIDAQRAGREAMTMTFFHWGLHAWAIYIVMGLALAYFSFRKGLPLMIRSTLWPIFGRRIYGPIGQTIEVLAICATLFGVATSLGLGVKQIAGGMEYLGWLAPVAADAVSRPAHIVLIAVITLIATVSVVTGLEVGIRRLSELNLGLGFVLVLFVLIAGPMVFLFGALIQGIGNYMSSLVELTFRTESLRTITEIGDDGRRPQTWAEGWTIFYWAWWISWSPFVGMFIARISRGRTIRQFIIGVLLVPTLFTFIWLTIFGGSALYAEISAAHQSPQPIVADAGTGLPTDEPTDPVFEPTRSVGIIGSSTETALFRLLGELPFTWVLTVLAMLVIATYFVTSSDSASLVVGILAHNGNTHPPVASRVFWALTEGAVAAVLLLAGGLEALQAGAIIAALPICLIMLLMCWALFVSLRREFSRTRDAEDRRITEVLASVAGDSISVPEPDVQAEAWRERLRRIVTEGDFSPVEGTSGTATVPPAPAKRADVQDIRKTITAFIDETVVPAFREIEKELTKHKRTARIEKRPYQVSITVFKDGEEEFSYAVRGRAFHKLSFAFPEFGPDDEPRILKAEVVVPSGTQGGYQLTEFTRQGIIDDFLNEYAQWREE
ncbi:MAG: BCCT family transporter [Phycisphaeraceae bacterium]|nr:BCCT family transporter [Phycisphaeraceae bacterium]